MLLALFCDCTGRFMSDLFGNNIVGFPTRRLIYKVGLIMIESGLLVRELYLEVPVILAQMVQVEHVNCLFATLSKKNLD